MSRKFPRMDAYIGTARMDNLRLQTHVIDHVPKKMNGLRAVFISDVHLRPNIPTAPLIDCIKRSKADIIFFGGDFSDTHDQALRLFAAFEAIHAPLGMYTAIGNNDTEAFESAAFLRSALKDCGIRLLVNESIQMDGFCVAGLDDHLHGSPSERGLFDHREGYRILLSHYPILPAQKIDLMLSGHTHGGQFNAFGLTPYAIGFEGIGKKKHLAPAAVSGLHEINGTRLLVSKGVGTSRIPMRIGVVPEIHLLKFEC